MRWLDAGTRLSRSSASSARPTGCSPRADVAEVARHLEVSEQSHQPVGNQFVDMKAEDATRLKDPERENRELKRIVPDKEWENRGQVTGEGAQDARTPRAGYRRPPGL